MYTHLQFYSIYLNYLSKKKKKTTLSHPKCFYYLLTLTLFNYSLLYIYVCINIYTISNSIRLHLTRAPQKIKKIENHENKNPIKLCEQKKRMNEKRN